MTIPRTGKVRDAGTEEPDSMGSAIAINFQPTGGGKCAITGDFVLTAMEVNPVIKAFRDSGIEVTALHNHMLNDEPRLSSCISAQTTKRKSCLRHPSWHSRA